MSADEARDKSFAAPARERTGPRHAAPKKPLFTRLHMPAGKAIAMAAMPTAVLMGMGFTPTLALADDGAPTTSNSLTADEYKECVAALAEDADGASASATPDAGESTDSADENEAKPTPSASPSENSSDSSGSSGSSGDSSSSDSGSDDAAEPTPTPSPSKSSEAQSGDTSTASPSPSESGGNLLEDIGDAISGIFTGGDQESASPSPTPSASASASEGATDGSASEDSDKDTSDPVKETTEKVTDTVEDTVKDTTDTASEAAEDATEAAEEATATPSPSASATELPEDCEAATEDEGGVDNKILVPDDPWYLEASSLTLKGADYQGIVEVKTASGKTKKVLKYVISDGTDIGDLHQLVKDKQSGKTHHVQAAKGSKSTITDGKTVMYTESISGNLLGLIPVTFDPEHPPPLNIPYIYFTKVKVTQAGQFGGTLTVPGLHQYVTD
ncbi:hypothetical protein EJ357_31895 [Streptomyces cyaneochromogenes]|uniref:Membrane-bound hydrophilic protein n=1 Tax=Streptomyces cyaneochromogenes TaxID=2496836 RepID=A0A3S9MNG8_9ACTN|nr:hypothetical protein [Streptomyces cyaneochromogenes]AZQ40706.1 hypothetical protein EJ357_31895 [Streptomyces cyaneochromogenes]